MREKYHTQTKFKQAINLYISVFIFLDSKQKDKRLLTEW